MRCAYKSILNTQQLTLQICYPLDRGQLTAAAYRGRALLAWRPIGLVGERVHGVLALALVGVELVQQLGQALNSRRNRNDPRLGFRNWDLGIGRQPPQLREDGSQANRLFFGPLWARIAKISQNTSLYIYIYKYTYIYTKDYTKKVGYSREYPGIPLNPPLDASDRNTRSPRATRRSSCS